VTDHESLLLGTASDECPEILATGRTDVTIIYPSLAKRHPEGLDAQYLEWHSLDHRPEQHRLAQLRASFRVVSTPRCRAARATSDARYDETDHLQTYFFTSPAAMAGFEDLNTALHQAGRSPFVLPSVVRAAYRVDGMAAAPRIKIGADVLLWWTAKGVYVIIERGGGSVADLLDVPGVGGAWWGAAEPLKPPFTTRDNSGLHVSYLFLDDEPAEVAERLRPRLEQRWSTTNNEPLLAAPFHSLVAYEWDRYLP
jgi:hypothetical protein